MVNGAPGSKCQVHTSNLTCLTLTKTKPAHCEPADTPHTDGTAVSRWSCRHFIILRVTGSWAVCVCAPRTSGRPCSRSAGLSWAVRHRATARPARHGTTSRCPSPLAGATSKTGGCPPFFLLAMFSKSGLILCSCAPNAAPDSRGDCF